MTNIPKSISASTTDRLRIRAGWLLQELKKEVSAGCGMVYAVAAAGEAYAIDDDCVMGLLGAIRELSARPRDSFAAADALGHVINELANRAAPAAAPEQRRIEP